MSMDVVIIGAGMAGLAAGRMLGEKGCRVVLLDKGRGVGGRVATRRLDRGGETQGRWDHGAQSMVLRSGSLKQQLAQWGAMSALETWCITREGLVRWRSRTGINAFAKALAAGLSVRNSERVVHLGREQGRWRVGCESGATFEGDCVLCTLPAPQLQVLLEASALQALPGLAALRTITYASNLTLLAEMDGPSGLVAPGIQYPASDVLERVVDNAIKGISGCHTVTAQAQPGFSEAWYDGDRAAAGALLVEALEAHVGSKVVASTVHGWKFAEATQRWSEPFLELGEGLFAAGDGYLAGDGDVSPAMRPRVESALLSGMAAAAVIAGV